MARRRQTRWTRAISNRIGVGDMVRTLYVTIGNLRIPYPSDSLFPDDDLYPDGEEA